jgi:UDP-N-acetylmuramoyl-tripeptide--D-alanyl-D-alanine ligase
LKLTLGQIADWIHAEGDVASDVEVQGYSIDSRTVAAGELFFAVKGERMDGHDYVESAMSNGAAAAVVSMRWLAPPNVDTSKLLRVPDDECDCVLQSLQKLAHAVRRAWGGRVIGVTGSAGKTTTKEAIAHVLGASFRVLKSAGNLNNHFGVPLQLLRLEPEHEVAVIEMGMNHAGEIAALAKIAEPDWGVVSNVAPVHLEHFVDGIEGIAHAKFELIAALPEQGIAFLNADDERVAGFAGQRGGPAVLYGTSRTADVRAVEIEEHGLAGVQFVVEWQGRRAPVQLELMGRHNVLNALAAIAVGVSSGMPLDVAAAAIAGLQPTSKRGGLIHWRGATLVNDSYNSNPQALDAMVDALLATPAVRRIVVAGEMLELGPEGEALHIECGRRMGQRGISIVVGVRGLAEALVHGARDAGVEALFVATPAEAGAWLVANLRSGDLVLLKGSRGVRLEGALDALAANV